jgi:YD repeat-containing protein
VTEFNAAGKILSEKKYGGQPLVLGTQINYTYDALGSLLKKTTTPVGSSVQEERYTNNSVTGKPEKMEMYSGNVLAHTVVYYYE